MINQKLAIAIPTYNRAEILKENLELMLNEIQEYNLPIYISDDSTNNETSIVATDFKKKYAHIFYSKNTKRLGHDLNCENTLKLPDTDYVWYLGDSIIINDGIIKKIVNLITKFEYEIIVVNAASRVKEIDSGIFKSKNELLQNLGWHMTLTGATIYSKKLIENTNFERFYGTDFIQEGIIFEYFSDKESINTYWLNDNAIYDNPKKKSYWSDKIFKIFGKNWTEFILSLPPQYSLDEKLRCIMSHGEKTQIFSLENLLKLRKSNEFNLDIYHKYYRYFNYFIKIPKLVLLIISIFPKSIIKLYFK